MVIESPKKEFIIAKQPGELRSAIIDLAKAFPTEYKVDKTDDLLKHYRLTVTNSIMMDLGYYADFFITTVNNAESKIVIELNKRGNALGNLRDNGREVEVLRQLVDRFGLSLSGNIHQHAAAVYENRDKSDKALSRVLWIIIATLVSGAIIWILANRH
jgi:hypothetical protein